MSDHMSAAEIEASITAAEAALADAKRRLAEQRSRDEAAGIIPAATLEAMLREEAARRLSPETQEAYARVEAAEGDDSWMEVTAALQADVCRAFGFGGEGSLVGAVAQLRAAAPRYPSVAFWVKHNRSRRGNLARGQAVPNVALSDALGSLQPGHVGLHDLCPADGRPLGVIALSYS